MPNIGQRFCRCVCNVLPHLISSQLPLVPSNIGLQAHVLHMQIDPFASPGECNIHQLFVQRKPLEAIVAISSPVQTMERPPQDIADNGTTPSRKLQCANPTSTHPIMTSVWPCDLGKSGLTITNQVLLQTHLHHLQVCPSGVTILVALGQRHHGFLTTCHPPIRHPLSWCSSAPGVQERVGNEFIGHGVPGVPVTPLDFYLLPLLLHNYSFYSRYLFINLNLCLWCYMLYYFSISITNYY